MPKQTLRPLLVKHAMVGITRMDGSPRLFHVDWCVVHESS